MGKSSQCQVAGKHRKSSTLQSTTGRVAFVAITSATVAGAGAAIATAETPAQAGTVAPQIELTGLTDAIPAGSSAPQTLALAEYKPVAGLDLQLTKAIDAATEHSLAFSSVDPAAQLSSFAGGKVAKPANGILSSGFGMRWGAMHAGIDIANAVGTPIFAVMDGTVIDSGPAQGYGQWIRILHDDGSVSVYGHMETLNVGVGQRVAAGQLIAGMGSRGFSTGPHLHFEIHPAGMGAVDPAPWLAARGIGL
ncbi:M23 family metallopeptidase [Corynebacterium uterequi]|uniref:Peptidase family M23 n=1 Tax=Corynebacterium uterequi TaxID=1072256 RepID=A0A0G3HBP4_9CORY|nr:M23 family metallopeptidase [Corynebacterium uterequi]AKK10684.1 Peptidase family M23 [Corynebacterium uterequi]